MTKVKLDVGKLLGYIETNRQVAKLAGSKVGPKPEQKPEDRGPQ